jgi:hypothetical protein
MTIAKLAQLPRSDAGRPPARAAALIAPIKKTDFTLSYANL